ncbi:MAG: hypothetical protein AVDCRST_MAG73-494 [uncultured Thermomicrobiales bacterium]|uniref:Uncharacterized protein n=1 Tax=uncultured Thermomicrobiales bacterium TaxID=1645740 RepID=A0A6J4TLK1_9BACT|nr:MAG: hypothetical protein AVDCRST_MAG73-494 [uncultured Thermomicrobiales bacterium]
MILDHRQMIGPPWGLGLRPFHVLRWLGASVALLPAAVRRGHHRVVLRLPEFVDRHRRRGNRRRRLERRDRGDHETVRA